MTMMFGRSAAKAHDANNVIVATSSRRAARKDMYHSVA
jgi:hypothetical protein